MRLILILAALALGGCGPTEESETGEAPRIDRMEDGGTDESKLWVTAERIDRHTCPSTDCGIVGTLSFREAVTVEELRGDWARVSKEYDASCADGRSEYVDKGNAACNSDNGIVGGRFAEWAEAKHLSSTRPADPGESAAADEQLVKDSDDFQRHRRAFVQAARGLIDRGECTAADFVEQGGFVKSSNHRDEPVYFTYCGGYTTANRIYLNASTGETYR